VAAQLLASGPRAGAPGDAATLRSPSASSAAGAAVGSAAAATTLLGSGTASTTVTGPVRRVGPRSNLKPVDATRPLPNGQPLPPLASMPLSVVSSFPEGSAPPGSAYRAVVLPWGFGPNVAAGPTVLVTVDSMEAIGGAPSRFGMHGRRLLVVMGAGPGESIAKGGRYAAVITLRPIDARLVPVLSGARPIGD
jgi:hypothetical protein